jgi:probable F420-dependent oxidoreductase
VKFCCGFSFMNPDFFLELAPIAEEAGWDTVMLSDHLVHHERIRSKYPYSQVGERAWTPETAWPDVWVSTAAMAAVTTRLRFMQSVFILPMRDPFTVAKALGTAARISNNRVSLGLGLGWLAEEFELLGTDFATRGARADEMVEVMRKLWSGKLVEHHGKFFDFPKLSMSPGLEQPVPIVVGGISAAAKRRIARLGDGWAPAYLTSAEIQQGIAEIQRMRRELGRPQTPLAVYTSPTDLVGSDLDGYRRMQDAGITHVMASPWMAPKPGADPAKIDIKAMLNPRPDVVRDGLRRFGDEVIAKL